MKTTQKPMEKLERNRFIFFQTGLIIALFLVLVAFEYQVKNPSLKMLSGGTILHFDEEEMPIVLPPPPPPPPQPQSKTVFDIVNNNKEVDDIAMNVELAKITTPAIYTPIEIPEEPIKEDEIILIPEIMPEFPGGEAARRTYLVNHVRYPEMAVRNRIQGTVHVEFVIEPDGSITNVRLLRGIGGGCDEEALRVVSSMPLWKPGQQGIRKVRTRMSMPIHFRLK